MPTPTKSIAKLILKVAADKKHRKEISLLPLMCGTGKSTAISQLIAKTIREADDTGNGLLVVTDRTDRLDDYLSPHDPELRDFLESHKDGYTIMKRDNVQEAFRIQPFRPVLMLTTQRYLGLTEEAVRNLLKWKGGQRPLVLIDERPEILKEIVLSDESFSANGAALRKMGIDEWLLEHWHMQFLHINALLNHLPECPIRFEAFVYSSWISKKASSSIYKSASFFFQPLFSRDARLIGDEDWLQKAEQMYKGDLKSHSRSLSNQDYAGVYEQMSGILQMCKEPALYTRYQVAETSAGPVFNTSFNTLLDRYDVLKKTPAKVIVLDGTGDLSPEYSLKSFDVRKKETADYARDLSRLKIRIVNARTGRQNLTYGKNGEKFRDVLRAYIKINGIQDQGSVLFTYKRCTKAFQPLFSEDRTEYFGNIVGKNHFRTAKHIFQVGINRFPNSVYFLYYLAFHPELKESFENVKLLEQDFYFTTDQATGEYRQINESDDDITCATLLLGQDDVIQEMMRQTELIHEIIEKHEGEVRMLMSRVLLAELEQNMFRGCIRDSDSKDDYTFHLFINVNHYQELIRMMKKRYEPLGASVTVEELPKATQLVKTMQKKGYAGKLTYEQRIINWHDNYLTVGEEYTPARLRQECEIESTKAYEQLLYRSSNLKEALEKERIARGRYKKKGNWALSDT